MKGRDRLYALLVLIIVIILVVYFTGEWKKLTGANPGFAVADTSRVEAIRIAGKDTVQLERSRNGWKVNDRYPADQTAVDNFLFAFSHLEVSGIVNASGLKGQQSRVITIHTGRREKKLRFYPSPQNSLMLREGSERAYRMEVAGIANAGLPEIFSDNPDHWREKVLINLRPGEIRRIEVEPAGKWGKGFIIERKKDDLVLKNTEGKTVPADHVDHERVLLYTSYFNEIFYDSVYTDQQATHRILSKEKPDYTIEVTSEQGQNYKLQIYPLVGKNGKDDIFRALVRFNNGDQLLVVNYVVLDLLRQRLSHFTGK